MTWVTSGRRVARLPLGQSESRPQSADDDHRRAEHLATDHLLTNLKGSTIAGAVASGAAQVGQFVVNLTSIAVLARLLAPSDFGLVAMVTVVMGFLRIFGDGGLSTATMQRERITHAQVSNLFWANLALGAAVTCALMISAPVLVMFYSEPRLDGIIRALAVTFLIGSATVQHTALLKRRLRFGTVAIIQVCAVALGSLVGIAMAWQGFGYWSLIGIQLSTLTVGLTLTMSASGWRPQLPTRDGGTRSLLNFGANLTASGFLWSLARGSDSLLIGKFLGSMPLGLYSRAQALVIRPVEQFVSPFEAIFVPILCRLQTDPQRYRRTVLKVYDIIAVVSFPLAGLLLALADPLTRLVLGPKWTGASDIVRGFAPVALYTPVASIASSLLASQGRGRDFLRVTSISAFVTTAAFVGGLSFGSPGVAVAYSIACFLIHLPVQYYVAGRRGPITTSDLWLRFFKHLPLWAWVSGITTLALGLVRGADPLTQLVASAPVGIVAAAVMIAATPSMRAAVLNLFDGLQEWRTSRPHTEGQLHVASRAIQH